MLPDGLNWLCYFAGSSKSHRENSISFKILDSLYQVDMKNVVKSSKHFLGISILWKLTVLNSTTVFTQLASFFIGEGFDV